MPGWWVDLVILAVIFLAYAGLGALADLEADLERMEDEEP